MITQAQPKSWRQALGMGIYKARLRSGMTQQQVARRMRVHHTDMTRWEAGYAAPSALTLFNMASALGCSIDDLFSEISTEETNVSA